MEPETTDNTDKGKEATSKASDQPKDMNDGEQNNAATSEPSHGTQGSTKDDPQADNRSSTPEVHNNSPDERNPWDHSDRRVHVQGVERYASRKEVTKLVTKWTHQMDADMQVIKVKKPPNDSWMVVTFAQPDMALQFMDYINENNIQNKKGTRALLAKLASDLDIHKRPPPPDMDDSKLSKRQKLESSLLDSNTTQRPISDEQVKDKITPLWRLSPQEQLQEKTKTIIKQCAFKLNKEIKKRFRDMQKKKKQVELYDWLKGERAIDMQDVVSVPNAVRNKCEFTFGWRYEYDDGTTTTANAAMEEEDDAKRNGGTAEKTTRPIKRVPSCGMMAAGWAGGVSRPHCCDNISSEACAIVDIVDAFLADSPLPPYESKEHTGIWRLLTVRSSRKTRECMVIITHAPVTGGIGESGEDHKPHFESEKARLLQLLSTAKLDIPIQEPIQVTSIFFQEFGGLSSPTPETPVQHAYGKTCLHEMLGDCTFQISPGAFFQVNSVGAELLYAKVVEMVKQVTTGDATTNTNGNNKSLLFDVCCGTGTIGLTCMKQGAVQHVVGVDISEPAIQDAHANALLNGFTSSDQVRFVAARAEQVLQEQVKKARDECEDIPMFVAVVDPAREGLHPDVVRTLRATQKICRIVYVSCNPTGSMINDVALFCSPPSKRYIGRPFKVSSATPYDMFPLTNHCEMVMVLDRLTEEEMAVVEK